ncbi:Dimeric dUTPase, all-alpha-NTP-PPase (MazG) superfamily [Alkalithermobacter thermoalcaliphilus JW-YL-7 = DSM 7308]|uniref:dUTPase n=1 Tax=Alkalithermobacter thermoalcaliphilus JW-YL-7 = DSM 7308 TaxID=1121328 RepID=A0A150FQ23_CLOPD|nr:dUTPase [[Clostridium] paradoxum JW-YL-7 = DSM 7308]SHK63688.1 Dimeric dUTPase, all-alpha-NTP-PPase (MazG) superfamily [[Clostridium] paradoxum JW-YL-7 = DSM 7308]
MNLEKLYFLQKELDEKINITHNLHGHSLTSYKILALNVELSELANETRCFKFWSNKKSSPKNIVLEEFVDCLHFILSIGLDLGFDFISFEDIKSIHSSKDGDISLKFLEVFDSISKLKNSLSKSDYINMFSSFISLANELNLSESEIEDAYIQKNNINHLRQEEGY